ncbi:MAG: hypothetical protein ACRDP6_37235 [Actinoallomurus sp.]
MTNATEQPATVPPPSTWMSDHTVAGLQSKFASLVDAAREFDELTEQARKDLLNAEEQLQIHKNLAAGVRKEIEETQILLAIAQGRAPHPRRNEVQVTGDGFTLQFGALRLVGLPENATAEEHAEHAALMRAIYGAALDIADRSDTAGKALAAQAATVDQPTSADQPVTATGSEALTPEPAVAAQTVTDLTAPAAGGTE